MVTFQQLRAADPDVWHQQAAAWRALATSVDQQGSAVISTFQPLLEEWVGDDANTATARASRLRGELFAAADRIGPVADALQRHAETIAAAQARLSRSLIGAAQLGLAVRPDGSVAPSPQGLFQPGAPARARALNAEIASIIGIATDSDTSTAAALRGLAPVIGPSADPTPTVAAASVPVRNTAPTSVAAWWNGLSDGQRESLVFTHPELIGNLDGVPATFRDRANRASLAVARASMTHRIAALGPAPTPAQTAATAALRAQLAGLDAIAHRLPNMPGRAPAYLLGLDTVGNGRAVIALGNPDQASHVLTYVPGIDSGLATVDEALTRGDTLMGAMGRTPQAYHTSVIAWVGYDAPPNTDAAHDSLYADQATSDLTSFQQGLHATHIGPPATQTVLGDDYGSTVIGDAAMSTGLRPDAIVFTNSPGVIAQNAGQLGIDPSRVWAERDMPDPMGWAMYQGVDPTSAAFGARPLSPIALDDTIAQITTTITPNH
jgi:hypothetical protein